MRRALLAAFTVFALAGAAAAAQDDFALQKAYNDRLLAMDDSAPAHVELAKWCEQQGLAERALVHWQEALFRDPTSAEAKRALGLDSPVAAKAAEPSLAPPQDPAFFERQRAYADQIREIAWRYLVPTKEAAWAEGRNRILSMTDPAAVEPLSRILSLGPVEHRLLEAEALAGIPGDEARRALVRMILAENSQSAFLAAIERLRSRADSDRVGPLLAALDAPTEARRRAAYALGELRAESAIPALIAHLRAPEARTVTVTERVEPMGMFSGTIIPYVADVHPVVSKGAVAFDPVIGYIGSGVSIGSTAGPQEVTVEKTKIKLVEQPAVLEALKKITGQDFGYNLFQWRQWQYQVERDRAAQPDAAGNPNPKGAGGAGAPGR
jgi:hypothetical protein